MLAAFHKRSLLLLRVVSRCNNVGSSIISSLALRKMFWNRELEKWGKN